LPIKAPMNSNPTAKAIIAEVQPAKPPVPKSAIKLVVLVKAPLEGVVFVVALVHCW